MAASVILLIFTVLAVNAGDYCCCVSPDAAPPPTSCCPVSTPDETGNSCDCDGPCVYNAVGSTDVATAVAPASCPMAATSDPENPAPTADIPHPARLAPLSGAPPPDALHTRLARLQVWRN